MAKKQGSLSKVFTKGVLRENPVLRLLLGLCPALAVTTSARNGLGMGIAALFVLLGSNICVSVLRNLIPVKVRIPSYILIIAGFVTIVQMLLQAFTPNLYNELGIYIPLIVVNCMILARAELFAGHNPVLPSILDALGMGAGFTGALVLIGGMREILGSGSLFDISIPVLQPGGHIEPMLIFILPPGGFFIFGILIAISQKLINQLDFSSEKKEFELHCGSCEMGKNPKVSDSKEKSCGSGDGEST